MSNQHFKAAVLSTPSSVCILCKALKPLKQQYSSYLGSIRSCSNRCGNHLTFCTTSA